MISVVIPSFNRKDCVVALLSDVCGQRDVDFEVIVVDDCSTDESAAAIARHFPSVTLMVNEENSGPCVTRNRGIRAARGELIVGFDSDVRVPDSQLLRKVEAAFELLPDASGLAFRLFTGDGNRDDIERWWHPVRIEQAVQSTFETSYFSGTAYAFRREAMVAAGLFPEILYMHYEEVVLANRLIASGGRIFYLPALTCCHAAAATSRRSRIRTFYKPRNQILVAAMCFNLPRAFVYLLPRLVYNGIRSLLNGHFADWTSAIRSALELTPEAIKNRRPVSVKP